MAIAFFVSYSIKFIYDVVPYHLLGACISNGL